MKANRKNLFLTLILAVLTCTFSQVSAKDKDWNKELEKGYHELKMGNIDESIKIFQGKVSKNPSSGKCHCALGEALKKKGQHDPAKKEFLLATQVEPSYGEAFYHLGQCYEFDNQWQDAINSYRRYKELAPEASNRQALEDRISFCEGKI